MTFEEFNGHLQNETEKIEESIRQTEVLISHDGANVNEGDFELLKTLGRGYYGRVFLARKKNTG